MESNSPPSPNASSVMMNFKGTRFNFNKTFTKGSEHFTIVALQHHSARFLFCHSLKAITGSSGFCENKLKRVKNGLLHCSSSALFVTF